MPARDEIIDAKNVLVRRRNSTPDAAERKVIDAALDELNDAIESIDMDNLLQAAGLVARAADALERVIASARMGPFDTFLADAQHALAGLQGSLGHMQGNERLPPAPTADNASAAPMTAAVTVPAAAAPAAAATLVVSTVAPTSLTVADEVPVPINSKRFDELRDEYAEFFDRCRMRLGFEPNVDFYVSRLVKFKPSYEQLGKSLGIPWVFIGVIHGMECGFNFSTHLHNGDPLGARTVHVPSGRPSVGQPPFTWLESARDALQLKKLDQVTDWTLPRMLYLLEAYNGFGYRPRGVPTPYLWSFSNLYRKGKFVADGHFDAEAVSKQCGAAVMLRVLQERGLI